MRYIFILLLCYSFLPISNNKPIHKSEESYFHLITPVSAMKHIVEWNSLIYAIIDVESDFNDSAVNYSENAVGCLQIRPIMVNDINRILELEGSEVRFTLSDRYNRLKSIQMFNIWCEWYDLLYDYEKAAKCWNGGPNGYTYQETEKYWNNVNIKLEEIHEGFEFKV